MRKEGRPHGSAGWKGAAGLAAIALGALSVVIFSNPLGAGEGGRDGAAETGKKADGGVIQTASRAPFVHRINLYDKNGEIIRPADPVAQPYSPGMTCGKCHDYESIRSGWHFNAIHPNVDAGRPGQPWIVADAATATQIPITGRPWKGAFRPEAVGLTPWRFVQTFGRHTPGGGVGEEHLEKEADREVGWSISGDLEIDCMACHSADNRHDQGERARQIQEMNLGWVPTAASGLAVVQGSVRKVRPDYDPELEPELPQEWPRLVYDKSRFDASDRVFIDITRRPAVGRCAFCHSTRDVDDTLQDRWKSDVDVHLGAGMTCTDCHRNNIGHAIVRGYEGEKTVDAANSGDAGLTDANLSCAGCHLPERPADPSAPLAGGRMGAPRPLHRGLPPVHLEKLTCTACHSGPWPGREPRGVQTSMAHGLGIASENYRDDSLPWISGPVLVREDSGKIAPHLMIWPAFWGRKIGDEICPVPPKDVLAAAPNILVREVAGGWRHLSKEEITAVLAALGKTDNGEPVYIAGGKLYSLDARGTLAVSEHPAAGAYSWLLAHDVRPAQQSLGARYCTDCHSTQSGFIFGELNPRPTPESKDTAVRYMYEQEQLSGGYERFFAQTFALRTPFKIICSISAVVIAFALAWGAASGASGLLRRFGGAGREDRPWWSV